MTKDVYAFCSRRCLTNKPNNNNNSRTQANARKEDEEQEEKEEASAHEQLSDRQRKAGRKPKLKLKPKKGCKGGHAEREVGVRAANWRKSWKGRTKRESKTNKQAYEQTNKRANIQTYIHRGKCIYFYWARWWHGAPLSAAINWGAQLVGGGGHNRRN